ncbi:hypothetical protein OO013_02785 [Mangrovivirga sp. M17]|uniref:Uncharacterized protein n=1 Tax=Mangrovivirga halotolerans TaxID=2993936 RepID=A0ABT3RMN9_9BACT|nr:hypothetical protein [Mangrovivirga halotolerans]MCX2742773.1 hypothetical protein [Mangrovivirga halotolerans]
MKSLIIGNYFSKGRIVIFIILILFGILALLKGNLILLLILLLLSALVLTTKYGFSLDLENNIYHDYILLFGFKIGKKQVYEEIDCIFYKINSSLEKRSDFSTANSSITRKIDFDAYIRFSDNRKVHLGSFKNEGSLIKKIKPYAESLNTRFINLNNI